MTIPWNSFSTMAIVLAVVALLVLLYLQVEQRMKRDLDGMRAMVKSTSSILHEYRKFKAAFEYSYDAMVIADAEGTVLFINDSVTRITGYTRSEAVGKKAGSLWGGLMPKKYYRDLWHRIKKEQQPFFGEITNKRKNGRRYKAAVSITPVFDDERRHVQFYVAIERDLSERTFGRT